MQQLQLSQRDSAITAASAATPVSATATAIFDSFYLEDSADLGR